MQQVSQNAVDENCAIEFAKSEIARKDGKVRYTKFSADYDPDKKAWAVMAVSEPMVPGGHVFVSIGLDGKVLDFMPGR